jgi:hypothetical protein
MLPQYNHAKEGKKSGYFSKHHGSPKLIPPSGIVLKTKRPIHKEVLSNAILRFCILINKLEHVRMNFYAWKNFKKKSKRKFDQAIILLPPFSSTLELLVREEIQIATLTMQTA